MLANYGVVVRQALVLDRSALNLTFQMRNGNSTIIRSVRYPEWIGVQQAAGNPNQPLTARFSGLDLYWASPLELNAPAGVSAEALFSSTNQAWLQTDKFLTDPTMIPQFESEAATTSGAKVLGAVLSGIFPGAYEGGPKPVRSAGSGAAGDVLPDLPAQKKASRIIVVGNTEFAGPLMQVTRADGRNLEFLVRSAEWLSSDDDIISIRGREDSGRLDRITDTAQRDSAMAFSRGINTIAVPLLVIIAGLFLGWRRKTRRSRIVSTKSAGEKGHNDGV